MKRKLDFITNSSSCSYLVYIPDSFNFKKSIEDNMELIDKELSKEWIAEEYTKDEFISELKQIYSYLIRNGETDAAQFEVYTVLTDILSNNSFMLEGIECGENESSFMININNKRFQKAITKINKGDQIEKKS